ncbi:MAG: hypothetical protein IPK85_03980 [Gemmatimonadetes bacterium]|nr:hypothetical protein [Gemmatimonadota bacterium]
MTRPPTFLDGHDDDAIEAAEWIAEHGAEPIEGGYSTFEECVEKEFGYTRDWAYKRIDFAETRNALLSTNVDIPAITNEGQARSHGSAHTRPGPGRSATPLRIFSTKRPQKVPLSEIRVRRPLP